MTPTHRPDPDAVVRVAMVQANARVGDLDRNMARALEAYEEAVGRGADLVVLPELFLSGYPPEDLLHLPAFLEAVDAAAAELASHIGAVPCVVGAPVRDRDLRNAALVMQHGGIVVRAAKTFLPNYGPFDEERYFYPADRYHILELRGVRFGLTVCEDLWAPGLPTDALCVQGHADCLLNLSASPFHRGKQAERRDMLRTRATDYSVAVLYCNLVGGQDELVFDGRSLGFNPHGQLMAEGAAFAEDIVYVDLYKRSIVQSRVRDPRQRYLSPPPAGVKVEVTPLELNAANHPPLESQLRDQPGPEREMADALCLGLKDYVDKIGFPSVIVGLSGGIDSALATLIAVRALGPDRVHAVSMPSRFNSEGTRSDARKLAEGLGIAFHEISIEPMFEAMLTALKAELGSADEMGVAAENLQARIRGQILMAFSNKGGHMVVATGNKSELSMGYATLYGDMVGGFAVLKDVTKLWVFRLARWLMEVEGMALPESILARPPSAELAADQRDSDSLPPYEELDPILEGYVEDDLSADELVGQGADPEVVARVIRAVDRNEYKRRQAPPGIRVTRRAFGKDRRMPIVQGFGKR